MNFCLTANLRLWLKTRGLYRVGDQSNDLTDFVVLLSFMFKYDLLPVVMRHTDAVISLVKETHSSLHYL